jgi:TRAP-type C4-dicarboxylate transport system permease small subunit
MKSFWVIFDRTTEVMAGVAGVILVFICAATCYTIGMRFLFRQTTIWIVQTTEYALLWIVFLGTTWLLREGGHITTDIIYSHLPDKTRRWLDIIMFVAGATACMFMVYFGIDHVRECISRNVTDVRAVTLPKGPLFIIIPIGSALLTIQFLRMAWKKFAKVEGR